MTACQWNGQGADGCRRLIKAEIIPTVIDDFVPSLLLQASWSARDQTQLGNTLKPSDLKDAPTLIAANPSDGPAKKASLVIALTDPDAPSRDDPKWSEFCHWIATAPAPQVGAAGDPVQLKALSDVIEYKPPGPPEKTGKHRYVFLAFVAANGTEEVLHPSQPSARKHWGYDGDEVRGVRQWAGENGLVPVGELFERHWSGDTIPIAGLLTFCLFFQLPTSSTRRTTSSE